ncbi:AAA-ATPase At3g28540-like [Tasmannia lanceolata]|uniref:AAA-ATPase At3g28540-like n=1 Tax=Tasmannia lanceolata TaxID=3420 RepID=UPI0040643D46
MEFLDWKSIGSLLATIMFLRTAIRDFLPPEVSHVLKRFFTKLFASVQSNISIIIEEFDSSYNNELFDSVQTYLSSQCFSSAKILRLSKPKNSKNLTFTMDTNQKVEDTFHGFKVKWSLQTIEKKTNNYGYVRSQESRYFELTFHKKYKDRVNSLYISHVIEEADKIKFKNRERRLYTNRSAEDHGRLWSSVPFLHPSTFDTVAMDPVKREELKADLVKFVNRKEFYSRVGRAWKRGYLLYGPPGTGKTSLIAAIANFLEFDIYDLELTAVTNNSQLRKLLIATSSKSVIVVEDVDCTLDLSDRKKRLPKKKTEREGEENEEKKEKEDSNGGASTFSTVSLSGVLNFVDGLWSSCGGERVMIFTTNHIEKLDPALLRPGRMDKHINLSYCDFSAFKILMRNYLYIEEHKLEEEVEGLFPLVKITPADVAEVFMSCNDDADLGMKNLVEALKKRLASEAEPKEEIEDKEKMDQDEILEKEPKKEAENS